MLVRNARLNEGCGREANHLVRDVADALMFKVFIFTVSIIGLFSLPTLAQTAPERTRTDEILAVAEQYFQKGEACLAAGNLACARREFDAAIDSIFDQKLDVRGDGKLRAGLRELIEKINRLETAPTPGNAGGMWRTQDFEGRPPTDAAEIAETDDAGFGPITSVEFQRRFAALRKAFQEKYSRDITLTGADHGEHTRLYGRGSAFDIRVRDLTREQVGFIVATGNKLGLRIKDFSTWDRVAAHNARSAQLGRPLDTYASGVHLHIDRMGPTRKPAMLETPAIKKLSKASTRDKQ